MNHLTPSYERMVSQEIVGAHRAARITVLALLMVANGVIWLYLATLLRRG